MIKTEAGQKPTRRQQDTIDFIEAYMEHHGYAPTIREISIGIGLGPTGLNAVVGHLHLLKKKGCLVWDRKRARSLKLLTKQKSEELAGPRVFPTHDGILVCLPDRPLTTTEARSLAFALTIMAQRVEDS